MANPPTSFRALLQQTSENIERPRALAAGHYIGEIKNFEFGTSRQKQTPFVRLLLTPYEPTDDVEEGANDGMDLAKRELRKEYYITPGAMYRLSDMLDAVIGPDPSHTFDERLPDLRAARVLFSVTRTESADGTEVFNNIGTIVAAPDEV